MTEYLNHYVKPTREYPARCSFVVRRPGWAGPKKCGYRCKGPSGGEGLCDFHSGHWPQDDQVARRMTDARYSDANLYEAQLHRAYLRSQQHPLSPPEMLYADMTESQFPFTTWLHANLSRSCLHGVDGHFAKFGNVRLEQAHLCGGHLTRAQFVDCDLRHVTAKGVVLRGAKLDAVSLDDSVLAEADLTDMTITGGSSLRNCDLSEAWVSGLRLSADTDVTGVTWWQPEKRMLRDERVLRLREEHVKEAKVDCDGGIHNPFARDNVTVGGGPRDPSWSDCQRVYRDIRRCYQVLGMYREASEFFIREQECRRADPGTSSIERVEYGLMYWLCAYGEKWWMAVGWTIGLILVFALLQAYCFGIRLGGSPDEFAVGPGASFPTTLAEVGQGAEAMFTAVYFSAVTFTSLGYGDFQPAPGGGQLLAIVEAGIGVFMMALVVTVVVRRWMR
jgi:hypothetical protein